MDVKIITVDDYLALLGKIDQISEKLDKSQYKNAFSAQWISDPDAAKMLKVCTRQMYNLRMTGELGFTKINGKVFYKISDIEFLLEKNYVKSFKNNSLKK